MSLPSEILDDATRVRFRLLSVSDAKLWSLETASVAAGSSPVRVEPKAGAVSGLRPDAAVAGRRDRRRRPWSGPGRSPPVSAACLVTMAS